MQQVGLCTLRIAERGSRLTAQRTGQCRDQGLHRRIAYERLFLDAFNGNHTLFVRDDEVRAAWAWIDSVADAWKEARLPLEPYPAGQWGPANAADFLPQGVDAPDTGAGNGASA